MQIPSFLLYRRMAESHMPQIMIEGGSMMENDNNNQGKKRRAEFNILSGDATEGDSDFGVGTINLDNVTPVIVDPEGEAAYIDMKALHARSQVEKRVRFSSNKEEHPDSRVYWIVWVVADRGENGPHYSGIGACEIRVSREQRRIRPGYKAMPEHVNHMDKALKHHIIVDNMDEVSKKLLGNFLKEHNPRFWENTSDDVKENLGIAEES